MPTSLAEWDAKHRAAGEAAAPEAAAIVSELLPLLPLGPALDLACGTGRHTLLLASRGQPVTAVDGSEVALDILERRARMGNHATSRSREKRGVSAGRKGIQLVHADLERVSLPAGSFSLILCVNYLQRSLFGQMEDALAAGGALLFETYTRAQLEFSGGPRSPEYLLRSGELRTAFPGLQILFYRELRAGNGIASLLARKGVD
jgi:tellurite methyltransferase